MPLLEHHELDLELLLVALAEGDLLLGLLVRVVKTPLAPSAAGALPQPPPAVFLPLPLAAPAAGPLPPAAPAAVVMQQQQLPAQDRLWFSCDRQ